MVRLFGIGLILLGLGLHLVEIEVPTSAVSQTHETPGSYWRRTNQGWEQLRLKVPNDHHPISAVHPAIVGLLQLGLSVWFLVAFSEEENLDRESLRIVRH